MKTMMMAGLVLVAILASACGAAPTPTKVPPTLIPIPTNTPQPTATPSPIPTATATAVPTPSNPGLSLFNAYKAWGAVKSFRVKSTTGGTTGTQDMTIEFVAPDKYHMTGKDTTGKDIEMIIIGKNIYMKAAGLKWQKAPVQSGFNTDTVNPQKVAASMGAQKDVKFVGPDVVDGVPTMVYQYTSTTKAVTKVWIGALDSLLRKSESEPKSGLKTTSTFYDFNASIAITAPI